MKSLKRQIIIWGIWVAILLLINGCFILQGVQTEYFRMNRLIEGSILCSIAYAFYTVFYVVAVTMKQYRKMIYILIIDVVSSMAVIMNIGYFYEGPSVARNSFIVIIVLIIVKIVVLMCKKVRIER